jgi:DHA3 family macrolide efflux protein-like MFS transporter
MNIKHLNKEQRNYYLFIIGQFVSQFGSKLTSYGLILWSYKQSGSVLSMSLLSICYLVPEVLLSFISGGISDRWNKKKIMLAADAIAAFFSLLVITMLLTDTLRIEYLYIINVFLGIMDSFQNPASEATISLIVPKSDLMKTSGMRTFFYSITGIFAPVAATALYAFYGLQVIIIMDLSTFLFAFFTLALGVKIPTQKRERKDVEEEKQSLFSQCIFGLKYLISKQDVFALILFMAFVNLIAAIYNTSLPPMVLLRNGDNDIQLGIVTGAVSVSTMIGSMLVARFPVPKKRASTILNIMTFSFLFCNGLLGIGRNYYVWTFAVLGGNLFIPFMTANIEYIMRTRVPIELQGRVFAARNTLQYTSIPIGNLLAGILADKVFRPYMNVSKLPIWKLLVGTGEGAGLGLLFLCIAFLGVAGCCIFRMNRKLRALDLEQEKRD